MKGKAATRLLAVVGPTATGKTALAIALAQALNGEIVNADSRQVYRHLEIGTAKPTAAQRAAVPHHLLDLVDPDEPFTLADYLEAAQGAIDAIVRRERLPIVVGGTGLYIRALIQGFAVPQVAPNAVLRAELEALLTESGPVALLARLRTLDPARAESVDPANPRRLMRAIEVATAGPTDSARQRSDTLPYDALLLGLTADRAVLYERADRRVEAMLAQGFLDEVRALYAHGYSPDLPALSSLGYRELGAHLRGDWTLEEAAQATAYATHRFIRRQLTWFRREPDLCWLDLTAPNLEARALERVRLAFDRPVPLAGQAAWSA